MKRFSFLIVCYWVMVSSCNSKIDFDLPETPPDYHQTSELVISEISFAINTDPNANGTRPHYVELYNGTLAALDLSNYAIGYQATTDVNTLTDWSFPTSDTYLVLTGSLEKGKCYIIASPTADQTIIKRDISWGTTSTANADASKPLQLSGNSGIALLKKDASGTYMLGSVAYKIVDVFGSPNVARVTSGGSSSSRNNFMWTIAGETSDTRNRTFWRKPTVTGPNSNWAVSKGTSASDSEWELSGDRAWSYANLGIFTK